MLDKYMHIKTQLPCFAHLTLIASLILGIVIGFVVTSLSLKKEEFCKIGYISRDEILTLEKTRIAMAKEKRLFFGQTSKVINLIRNISKTREKAGHHIIFTKGSYVKGRGVYSISEDVHKEVIRKLKNETENSAKETEEKSESERKSKEQSEDDDQDENEMQDANVNMTSGRNDQVTEILKNAEKSGKW